MSHERQATRALHAGFQMGSSSPLFSGNERTSFAVIADGLAVTTHKRNTLPQAVILGMMSRRSVTPAGSQEPVPSSGSGFGIRRNDDLKALATPPFSIRYRNVLSSLSVALETVCWHDGAPRERIEQTLRGGRDRITGK